MVCVLYSVYDVSCSVLSVAELNTLDQQGEAFHCSGRTYSLSSMLEPAASHSEKSHRQHVGGWV